jgi:hypothetical protein
VLLNAEGYNQKRCGSKRAARSGAGELVPALLVLKKPRSRAMACAWTLCHWRRASSGVVSMIVSPGLADGARKWMTLDKELKEASRITESQEKPWCQFWKVCFCFGFDQFAPSWLSIMDGVRLSDVVNSICGLLPRCHLASDTRAYIKTMPLKSIPVFLLQRWCNGLHLAYM